ncbi:MAG: SdrD B-like domain-containing protein [Lacibacter sp.]
MTHYLRVVLIFMTVLSATQAKTQITGTVYRDYNGNGTRQTVAPTIEPGVPGVVITAYNSKDVVVNTTVSAVDGSYSLAYSVPVRLEFTFPSSPTVCVDRTIDFSSFNGDGNSVRFVSSSSVQNYAINNPAEFISTTNPSVFLPQYANGNPLVAGTSQNATWFVGFPYTNSGISTPPAQTLSGASATIGTTWGVAYSKQSGKIFTAAFLRRHIGLGTMGSGGIYMLTPTATAFTVSNFYDMDAVANSGAYRTRADASTTPPAYGNSSSYTLNNGGTNSTQVTYNGAVDPASGQPVGFGVIGTNTDRGLSGDFTTQSNDPAAFDQVGKVGLGDLEISDDGRFLFAVNLYDRKVYRLTLNDAYNPTSVTAVTSYTLPNPPLRNSIAGYSGVTGYNSTNFYDGTTGIQRAFALKYYRGKLYVGAVTTGENGGAHTLENNTGVPEYTDLWSFVYELNAPTGTASFNTTPTLSYPLNYNKGAAMTWTSPDYAAQWYLWTRNTSVTVGSGNDRTYPQPILSNLEFSDKGDLILSFMDRGGHQFGWWNYRNLSGTTIIGYPVGGDMLIAGKDCSTGGYTMEFNGSYTNNGSSFSSGAANNQGPGNSEFFKGDALTGTHDETALGSAAVLPGDNRVILANMDPDGVVRTGGTSKFSLTNGAASDGYRLYLSANNMSTGTLGKSGGLGDIEIAGVEPPVEIGNRVWNDVNKNGIQDAGEPGISGIVLELVDASNNAVDSDPAVGVQATFVTTNASGNWYLTSAAGTDATGINYGVNLLPNTVYKVRLATSGTGNDWDPTANGGSGGPRAGGDLVGFNLTLSNQTGNGAIDLSDNDAIITGSIPEINVTTGAYGQNNHTLDFGFSTAAELGNWVWLDNGGGNSSNANNGIQDPGEVGLAGIPVQLYQNGADGIAGTTDDILIGSTLTDAYGAYLFTGLVPTDQTNATTIAQTSYSVQITAPVNYSYSPQTNSNDNTSFSGGATAGNGSDVNTVTGRTGSINLTNGESDLNQDAGLYFVTVTSVLGSIGDKVWIDSNGNGVQDSGEPGVAGVTVTLYNGSGVALATTITDATGTYLFTNLASATYSIGFTLPADFLFATKDAGGNDNTDSDVNTTGSSFGKTDPIVLGSGQNLRTLDAGIVPGVLSSIGDRVWNDLNSNGIQDAGEPGIAGVTVELLDGAGNAIDPDGAGPLTRTVSVTDAFGNYIFSNLGNGSYIIDFNNFSFPSGYSGLTSQNQGTNDALDSDADPSTGRTQVIVINQPSTDMRWDAGLVLTSNTGNQLGNFVWFDYNQNGLQDANENGVPGVTAILYTVGMDGLAYTNDDIRISTTVTDLTGWYQFVNLSNGNYYVVFANIPNGYRFTQTDAGADGVDSDVFGLGFTPTVSLTGGTSNQSLDAGIIQGVPTGTGTAGNQVWVDLNADGIQNAGEPGVPGVTVTLSCDLNLDGDFSDPGEATFGVTQTDRFGNYLFTGLPLGLYKVTFSTIPSGYSVTTSNAGSNDEVDSDGLTPPVFYLNTGEDNLTLDLGLTAPAGTNTLGDYVWFDNGAGTISNAGNGIQDAGEQGVPGVQAVLLDATGNPVDNPNIPGTQNYIVTTDKNGFYLFVGLSDGTYRVSFTNLPAGFTITGTDLGGNNSTDNDANSSGLTESVTLNSGNRNDRTVDAGIVSTRASLGNYVWLDIDGDGIQDGFESGIPGVTVLLYNNGGTLIASAITDANGNYLFSNLTPGTYTVGFSTIPEGLQFTTLDQTSGGGNDTNDSDANSLNTDGRTVAVVLSAGDYNTTVDAGLRPIGTALGNYVWFDNGAGNPANANNGLQDAGEPGIAGVTATVFSTGPNGAIGGGDDVWTATAVTNGDGQWLISGISAGEYYVVFSNRPDGSSFTTYNVGGNGSLLNSKANTSGGETVEFTVENGSPYLGFDAGLINVTALPLRALTLKGNYNGQVNLQWNTIEEQQVSFFEVERSFDGLQFSKVGRAGSQGEGSFEYDMVDNLNGLSGLDLFYRVKMVQFDGSVKYSNVLKMNIRSSVRFQVLPNPFADFLNVQIKLDNKTSGFVRMLSSTGQTVYHAHYTLPGGINSIQIRELNKLPNGLYLLELHFGATTEMLQLIKK